MGDLGEGGFVGPDFFGRADGEDDVGAGSGRDDVEGEGTELVCFGVEDLPVVGGAVGEGFAFAALADDGSALREALAHLL
ncbi:MAG: hypothetical protein NTV52_28960, partial [Acidobacteria bacterium]|nr:hypothetical protein [Acidobacteriota bacterium]